MDLLRRNYYEKVSNPTIIRQKFTSLFSLSISRYFPFFFYIFNLHDQKKIPHRYFPIHFYLLFTMVQENNSFLLIPHRKLPFPLFLLPFPHIRIDSYVIFSINKFFIRHFLSAFEAIRFISSIDIFLLAKIVLFSSK